MLAPTTTINSASRLRWPSEWGEQIKVSEPAESCSLNFLWLREVRRLKRAILRQPNVLFHSQLELLTEEVSLSRRLGWSSLSRERDSGSRLPAGSTAEARDGQPAPGPEADAPSRRSVACAN